MKNHSVLLCVLCFMQLFFAGVFADEITHVDLPEETSTHTIGQSSILTVQMSEDTYSIKDGISESKDQSTSISSVPVEQSVENGVKESELSKSLNSADLEPSFSETLTTSLKEQSVTQSVGTATVITTVTSSEDDQNGQKSVVESSSDTRETNEGNIVNEISEPVLSETTQAEDQTVNETLTKELENKDTAETTLEPVVVVPIEPQHQVPDPGTGGAAIKLEPEAVKPEEEGLTFNEWTQKVLAEAERGKQAEEDMDNVPLPPVKVRKRKNYASYDCGAKILTCNPEATNAKSVLNANRDEYMNNPCKAKKWFVIELCEPIQAHSVEIASLELFSSQPKQFKVFLSDRFPTKDWKFAGEFETKDERSVQVREVTAAQDYFAKYVRVEVVDHFGDEHFCPLTFFRVLGIAVGDYEVDHHGISEGDDDDDDDDDNGDVESDEGSKNLFTSAKNTVISIVKKVLNVESDIHDININGSEPNATLEAVNATMSNMASKSEDMLPCPPGAIIKEGGSQIPACSETGKSSVVEPQPPVPGKTDSVIVVKLADDEQVETTDSDIAKSNIPLSEHLKNCYNNFDEVSKTVTPRSCFHSKLCVFTFMVYRLCHAASFDGKELTGEVNKKIEKDVIKNSAASVDVAADEVKTIHQENKDAKHETKAETEKSDISAFVDEDKTVQKTSKVDDKLEDKSDSVKPEDVTVTPSMEDNIAPKPTKSPTVASSYTEATQTVSSLPQTSSEVVDSETRLVSDSQKIDPSPSFVDSSQVVLHESDMQATPSLSEDWEPHTKDVMKEEVTTASQKTQTMTDTSKVSHGTTPVAPISPETPKVSIATEASSPVETVDTVITDEDVVELETEAESVEQKPNTTIIDEKVVVSSGGNGKKDEHLNLVRLTAMSGGKRESAIMRLSNRIKVLEQNVSLSSRFLEELSRRYKKQSEDMMKMLNKTLSQLNNVSVEADVKSKIHEDELTALEARLVNVTETLNKLTHSFNSLNQQVTDRQMIWTSIEILIIIVVVMFLYFRRKQVTVPQDVKALIEAMPAKPDAPLPQRRNSLSGPPTPSKEKALGSLHSGGGLQRFSSETALGSANQEFLNPNSSDMGIRQNNDGNRKKKKKKHKGSDLKLFSNASVPFHSETGSVNTRTNSSQPVLTNTQSTNSTNQSGLINSANLLQCSKSSKSCFGSMLSGWNGSRGNKGRSSSFDTANSPDDVFIESQLKVQSGAKDNGIVFDCAKNSIGAKNGIKGPTKKPPLPAGSKKSPKLIIKSSKPCFDNSNKDTTNSKENLVLKGHRRQKSLPKMHYTAVENIGPSCKKTRNTETLSKEKNDGHIGAMKSTKRDEASRSPQLLPESRDIRSMSDSAYPVTNGHHVSNELYDSEQMDKCYSLEKSPSDIYFTSSCGRDTDVEGYANSLTGHYSGVTYDETFDAPPTFTQNGADFIENDDCFNKNQMPVNIAHVPSNSKWKNMFGFFR